MSKIGSGAMEFMGGMTGKPASSGGSGSSSWAQAAGELAGGILGTGGGSSGSMAGMAGQVIGGATGMAGGKDGSVGAQIGQTVGGLFGKKPEPTPEPSGPVGAAGPGGEAKPEEEKKDPTITEQLPGLVGSVMGETRMKGCWKRAKSRGLGHIPSKCGEN